MEKEYEESEKDKLLLLKDEEIKALRQQIALFTQNIEKPLFTSPIAKGDSAHKNNTSHKLQPISIYNSGQLTDLRKSMVGMDKQKQYITY